MKYIKAYLPLCWLNAAILKLPVSQGFFKHNMFFYFAIMFFIQFNMSDDIEAIFEVILETLLTLGFIGFILFLNRTLATFTQVATAILFSQNAISILLVPVVFWLTAYEDSASYLVLLTLLAWAVVLVARIFKQVLFINNAAALIVSLSYFVITYGGAYGIDSLVAG